MMCKLDLEKTYDHVNWEFLGYVLWQCGFGVKWREWIQRCISLTSFSVLINGVSLGHFSCSRGFWQGDHLSPRLFILVISVLESLIGMATEVGMFEGFSLGQGEVVMSHLQFADDTIIFCDNSLR